MSASKSTTNYKLPVFVDSDIPQWLTDFNGAMEKIYTTIKQVSDSIPSDVGQLVSDYAELKESVSSIESQLSTINESITALTEKVKNVVVVDETSGTGISAKQYSHLMIK